MPIPAYAAGASSRRGWSDRARARITMTTAASQPSIGGIVDSWYVIEYTDDSFLWKPVRGAERIVAGLNETVVVYDYEIPPTKVRMYRATLMYLLNSGDVLASEPAGPLMAVMYLRGIWVKDIYNPELNFTVPVETKWMPITNNKPRRVVLPLGREKPVVVGGAGNYDQWSYTYTVVGDTAWELVQSVLRADRTFLVQTPKRQWYAQVSDNPNISEDNFSVSDEPARQVTLSFTEVDAP